MCCMRRRRRHFAVKCHLIGSTGVARASAGAFCTVTSCWRPRTTCARCGTDGPAPELNLAEIDGQGALKRYEEARQANELQAGAYA
jgi:hypothetical protein